MGLTTRCPKCGTDVREGARRCPMCGTPLSVAAFEAPPPLEGAPISDPLLELFDRDEPVRVCPSCLNEFATHVKACAPCGVATAVAARSAFEASLCERPIHDRGSAAAKGPPDVPRDLVRVHACSGPAEARARIKDFRFMGVRTWPGSDALDPTPDAPAIGLYVRAAEVETAKYLLLGPWTSAPQEARPGAPDPRADRLREAAAYLEFGKSRRVVAVLAPLAGDPDAEETVADAMLAAGRVREGERRAQAAAESAPAGPVRGRLRLRAGILAALGDDGSPFGAGSRPGIARDRLRLATSELPRRVEAGKALIETLARLGEDAAALAEIRRLARVNPNVTALDGWFRTLYEALRAKLI